MSGRGPSSSDLAKRVEDLRMYRTNVRRYSTLDFKKRFQDQDRDIAGFGASAQRRKSLHVGEDDGEKGRRAYDVRLGARARSVRAAADEPFSSEEDGRLADSVARSRPSPSLRRPPDGAYPEVSDDDDDLNLDTRRHDRHRHDATSRSDDGLEGGRSGGRRVPHPEERKHPSGQRSSRQRYSGSSESDGEGSPRPRPSRGAWTRDTIIPAVNRRLSEKGRRSDERRPDYVDGGDSRPRHRSQERRRGETELREDDERHTSNRIAPASAPASPISEEDPFEEPYELDEPARSTERRALKTVPIEERPVDHKVPPNRLPQREYTKPIMIKREQQPRPVHEPQPQPDDLSAAVDVVREELKDVRSTIDETESPRASIDTTTRLLLKSVEEQSRLRALLEIRGVPADQDMATAAEARRAGEEADKRLTNTLNELERVVQQV